MRPVQALQLIALNVGVMALGAEAVVRATGRAPRVVSQYAFFVPDPVLPYRPAPDRVFSGRSATDEFDFELRHNRVGYRDVEHPPTKPKDTFRILGLGDSFTYGGGAEYEATYLRRLERSLQADGRGPVELVKAGIPRFFPQAERVLLETEGLAYEPDLVLLGFTPNDVIDTYLGLDAVTVGATGHLRTTEAAIGPLGTWLYLHSQAARLVLQHFLPKPTQVDWAAMFEDDGLYEEAWLEAEGELSRMARAARNAGAEFAVVHIPMSPFDIERLAIGDRGYPGRRLARWAEGAGVLVIDPLQRVEAAEVHEPLYWNLDSHCNARGYEVIAEAVHDGLVEAGLLPVGTLALPAQE